MDLHGKVGLVTGSATGIGRAITLAMARAGADVVVSDIRTGADADQTVADAKALGVKAIFVQADVSKDESISAAIAQAVKEFGHLDVLVNNAGTTVFVPYANLDGLTDAAWQKVLGVNVMGVFYASRAASKVMLEQKSGCIINIASNAGMNGLGSSIPYTVSKAAVISLTQTFARTLAPYVRVNAVAPGVVDTHWHDGHEENKTNFAARNLFGRVSTPEDIAEAAIGLMQYAGFVTGQTLRVDGGLTMA